MYIIKFLENRLTDLDIIETQTNKQLIFIISLNIKTFLKILF